MRYIISFAFEVVHDRFTTPPQSTKQSKSGMGKAVVGLVAHMHAVGLRVSKRIDFCRFWVAFDTLMGSGTDGAHRSALSAERMLHCANHATMVEARRTRFQRLPNTGDEHSDPPSISDSPNSTFWSVLPTLNA